MTLGILEHATLSSAVMLNVALLFMLSDALSNYFLIVIFIVLNGDVRLDLLTVETWIIFKRNKKDES